MAIVVATVVFVTCGGDNTPPAKSDPIRAAKVIHRRSATVGPDLAPPATSSTVVLEGQVIDEDDRPVEGARLTLQREPNPVTATSEGDGSFTLAAVPEGDYFVVASKDALTSPPATIHVGTRTEPITLRISRGCDARVHVVAAEDNSPIAGATVADPLGHSGTTAPDGTTELRGLVCDNIALRARAPGRESLVLPVGLAHGDIEDLTITLARGATLSGTVIGPDGALVANAHVYITTLGRFDFQFPRRVTADANGEWTSDGLAAGSYELEGASDLYTKADPFVVELDGIHDRTGVVVHLDTGAQLVGKVLDQRGAPVADALVEIAAETSRWATSTRTDATGAFAFLGIPPATYVVSASGPASASTHQRVEAPDHQRVEIELRVADSSIAGIVVDTRGEPIADVDVVAISSDTPNGTFRRAITNGAGRFDVGGAPPGSYRLFARRRDQTDDDGDGVIVRSGNRDVKLVLPD
ncbi:MAG: carboxypeptidase regulatory-like domain-containing protein, partial [Kofleriaceae bacterium]|nr:carboxypeptidase regulatory-like domain-containing protein [Kofleriaceae bacterium]